MAIIKGPHDVSHPGHPFFRKTVTQTRLVKRDIERQGTTGWSKIVKMASNKATPHPNWHCLPFFWRCVAQWAGKEWHLLTANEKATWESHLFEHHSGYPGSPANNFISANCYNWLYGHPFQRTNNKAITSENATNDNLTAEKTTDSVILKWTQTWTETPDAQPWGIFIIRKYEDPLFNRAINLMAIVRSTAYGDKTFIDKHPAAGANVYRVSSFNKNRAEDHMSYTATVNF